MRDTCSLPLVYAATWTNKSVQPPGCTTPVQMLAQAALRFVQVPDLVTHTRAKLQLPKEACGHGTTCDPSVRFKCNCSMTQHA